MRKRKLLKVDQLLLPESKIKPVGGKIRKITWKNRKAGNLCGDSSDSEVEDEKIGPVVAKENESKDKSAQLFDLWETEGKVQ